ncbi:MULTISPECIES: hypothetical protein, partial [unclassified Phaeobacter]|uniref:hypothetical protein n=2 Tax=unclassified Phaeobacter TaxID=2621772 RepID=UPI003A87974E
IFVSAAEPGRDNGMNGALCLFSRVETGAGVATGARSAIGSVLLAACLLIAVLVLSANRAEAHGASGEAQIAVSVQDMDQDVAGSRPADHCHGSSLCGGVAVLLGSWPSMQPDPRNFRPDLPLMLLRPLAITGFEPPPPRGRS